jgi:carbamate kinase
MMTITTGVKRVAINFGQSAEQWLDNLTPAP